MLEPKFEVPNSLDTSLPHKFDIHEITSNLILENCQGVYVFTKRHQVSECVFEHDPLEVKSTNDFSKIGIEEFQNAKDKGANCICTIWCNKFEMKQIIEDVLNQLKA